MASLDNTPNNKRVALTAGFQLALTVTIGFAVAGLLVALFVVRETDCRAATAKE